MNVQGWVGPTIAISLVIVAISFFVMGGVVLAIGLALRKHTRSVRGQIEKVSGEAREVTARLRSEMEGFADISAEARAKLRGAIDGAEQRLRDLDALVEVLQEEAEDTALDVAALMRTVRRTGSIFGAARKTLKRRSSRR
jgi:hypothetical protein